MPSYREKTVPLLDLARQFDMIRNEVLTAIERVCTSQRYILGPEVDSLEEEVARFVGAKAAVACSSGTDALWLALLSAGIAPGDRVITTSFSFFASASSIVRAGAEPVFVDVDPATLNLDPTKVGRMLHQTQGPSTSRIPSRRSRNRFARDDRSVKKSATKSSSHGNRRRDEAIAAVLPVHLYGQCADMDSLNQVADEHGLLVIEDAAQAIGAKWRERSAGSFGVTAAFSFYPTKNLSAFGDAGMVTTQDPSKAEHMRRLRNHGSPERYLHTEFGWNARMDAIQAAVLRVKLKHLPKWNQQRRERAETYDNLLERAGLVSAKSRSPIQRLQTSPHACHVFHQYVIRAKRRNDLRKFLAARGIGTEVYYPSPLHLQPVFTYLGYKEGDLPESEHAAKEVLALPMFPELTKDEQKLVVSGIAEFYS
jgi:dTDP-4-amino-4,6-dideoxygalactose transaminase